MRLSDSEEGTGKTSKGWLRSPLTWVLCGLFLTSATWFAILYSRGVAKDTLDMEFAKALLQVGVVSVAAALLSILVFGHQHRIERDQRDRERRAEVQREIWQAKSNQVRYRDELLKSTLVRITAAYNKTKRARRRMRAVGRRRVATGVVVLHDAYDKLMSEINDAQLELEAIKSDVKTSRLAYPSADALAPALRNMESYLGELLEEYENFRSRAAPDALETHLEELRRLADFLGPSEGSAFAIRFSEGHDVARAAIRGDLLHPDLPQEQKV